MYRNTYSILALANLMDLEAIATCAFLNLAFDLIVNDLIFGRGTLFPIGSQSSQEFFPVDVSVLVAVEHVGYGTHFHTTGRELCKRKRMLQ